MTLIDSLAIVFPLFPSHPAQEVINISDALEVALSVHIRTSFVPIGFGQTFLANIPAPTPFLVSLSTYLESTISPIISTALATQASVGSNLAAWLSIQPSFDSLILAAPPFSTGVFNVLFWTAILITIRSCLPPPPVSTDESSTGDDVVLRIET